MKTANRKFKIGDRVRLKGPAKFEGEFGIVKFYCSPTSDFDWQVETDNGRFVPVNDYELESA